MVASTPSFFFSSEGKILVSGNQCKIRLNKFSEEDKPSSLQSLSFSTVNGIINND